MVVHPLEDPDIDAGLQLPHKGRLIRKEILQTAHAFYLRACLDKSNNRFVFVLDSDPYLALAFVSAFVPWIKQGRADVIVVTFDKHQSNDARNRLVLDGKIALQAATGVPIKQWSGLSSRAGQQPNRPGHRADAARSADCGTVRLAVSHEIGAASAGSDPDGSRHDA